MEIKQTPEQFHEEAQQKWVGKYLKQYAVNGATSTLINILVTEVEPLTAENARLKESRDAIGVAFRKMVEKLGFNNQLSTLKELADITAEVEKEQSQLKEDNYVLSERNDSLESALEITKEERDRAQLDAAHDHADVLKLQSQVADLREALYSVRRHGLIEQDGYETVLKQITAALAKTEPKTEKKSDESKEI